MRYFAQNAAKALRHPGALALAILKQFRANQGLLLAGAVAYYALLSLVPLLILVVLALTHFFEEAEVLAAVVRVSSSSCLGSRTRLSASFARSWRTASRWGRCCWS